MNVFLLNISHLQDSSKDYGIQQDTLLTQFLSPTRTISFNHLPGLVLRRILKYTIKEKDKFKDTLSYLAICCDWKHAALPLVYKKVYISHSYNNGVLSWNTNIGLFLSSGYCLYAKQLYAHYSSEESELLLNILSLEPLQWPDNYQQKLIYSKGKDEAGNQLFRLYKKSLRTVKGAIGKFAQSFPRVEKMELHSSEDNASRKINTVLLDTFPDRLRILRYADFYGESLTNSLDNLTALKLWCDKKSFSIFPKLNTLTLEKLDFTNVPLGFTWGSFHTDPNSKEPVLFTNLRCLFWTLMIASLLLTASIVLVTLFQAIQ